MIIFCATIKKGVKMVDVNDYREEKSCVYKNETYLVRDNGAVLRKARPNQRVRKHDDRWTFGIKNEENGYSFFFGSNHRIHQIVATAFHGESPSKEYIVDHIDTNRQNNRPTNLRWITRLENVVLNEVTRKRIEYRTGVSIYEFLENPSAYRDAFDDPDFSWMRRVTEEEAKACLENVRHWSESESKNFHSNTKIGEWVYQLHSYNSTNEENKIDTAPLVHIFENQAIITDSLTPLAKQKNWRTPTRFLCCPEKVEDEPINCYLKRLADDAVFSANQYGKSSIVKYGLADDCIYLITTMTSGPKGWAVAKITFEDGYYLHESLGSFFTDEGAEKRFTLAQGLEWTGGDTFDDYC